MSAPDHGHAGDRASRFGARLTSLVAATALGCSLANPSEAEVKGDLAEALPGSLPAACGTVGSSHLGVAGIDEVAFTGVGEGTALAHVSNRSVFSAPKACDVRVGFSYRREARGWTLQAVSPNPP